MQDHSLLRHHPSGRDIDQESQVLLDLLLLLLAVLEQLKKSTPNADRRGGPVRF